MKLISLLIAVSCAGVVLAAEPEPAEDQPLDVETILSTTAAKEDYVDVAKCLPLHKIRRVKVLDEKHVAFEVGRDKVYLVVMDRRCPGLRPGSKISYETSGTTLCTRDDMRAVIEFGSSYQLGPFCRIPGFQEITKEQLVLIRDTLRNKK